MALNAPRADDEAGDVLAEKHAMHPAVKAGERVELVVGDLGWIRPESGEQVAELGPDRLDVSERDAGGDEADDLAIGRVGIAVNHPDRIARAPLFDVAVRAYAIERALDGAIFGRERHPSLSRFRSSPTLRPTIGENALSFFVYSSTVKANL